MPAPITFPDRSIPIVGQPVRACGYTLIAQLQCQCAPHGDTLQVIATLMNGQWLRLPTPCPRCQTTYSIQSLKTDEAGQLQFNLEMAHPPQA